MNYSEHSSAKKDVVIIGAGLTGLSLAVQLKKRGFSVVIIEKSNRIGGQIKTTNEDGFVIESGPNTGSGASEEVMDLFNDLSPLCEIEFAREESKKRLIWKNDRFHALPSGLVGGIITPLFTLRDKFRILGEPWRKKGANPDETVGALAKRRLGKSFVDYAVDPFLSGIYAGDAYSLVARHALPKLYNLEQDYGSFIRGGIAKSKEAKNKGEVKTKKGIFSAKGGMEKLPQAMGAYIGLENIMLSSENVFIQSENQKWNVTCSTNSMNLLFESRHVVTTVGAYALPALLPFIAQPEIDKISNVRYAPIVQIAVGVKDKLNLDFKAFGGLISSKDKKDFLGILFPSSCFEGRAPENGVLFSFFMGGMKRKELTELSDQEIEEKVIDAFHTMLGFPIDNKPDLIRIFRYKHAIPQYEISSEIRFETINTVEAKYPGLHIAGNLRDGIGMAHRITQASILGKEID